MPKPQNNGLDQSKDMLFSIEIVFDVLRGSRTIKRANIDINNLDMDVEVGKSALL